MIAEWPGASRRLQANAGRRAGLTTQREPKFYLAAAKLQQLIAEVAVLLMSICPSMIEAEGKSIQRKAHSGGAAPSIGAGSLRDPI
jgi:hypothetical protein